MELCNARISDTNSRCTRLKEHKGECRYTQEPVIDGATPAMAKPARCTYIVRFWMKNVGYGRQERDAMDALQAGHDVFDLLIKAYPDACVVIVGIVRK